MSKPIYSEKWISGRRGCAACLSVTEWPDLIHLSGEADHLTYGMVERWARKNYPDQTVQPASFGEGYVGVRIIKDQAPPAGAKGATEMSNKEDWTFDLGTDDKGVFTVEAWASTIPNRTYSRLTREQLLQLRREINSALRRYPKPEAAPKEKDDGEAA